jgi:hypothetical protein
LGSAAVCADNTYFTIDDVLPAPHAEPLAPMPPFLNHQKNKRQNNINHSNPKVLQGLILAYIAFETPDTIQTTNH